MISFFENQINILFQGNFIRIKPYGSFVTKILTPFSDIDMAIIGAESATREQALEILYKIYDLFRFFDNVVKINFISTANYPVIKMEIKLPLRDNKIQENYFIQKIDIVVNRNDGINLICSSIRTTIFI